MYSKNCVITKDVVAVLNSRMSMLTIGKECSRQCVQLVGGISRIGKVSIVHPKYTGVKEYFRIYVC